MQPSTDTNKTSDQWSCLHKDIIFLVIIFILKHALFRLMLKYPSTVINCLLCCMNCCYSWRVIRKSHRIHTCSHRIKFYNYTLRMRSDAVLSFTGALLMKTVTKKIVVNKNRPRFASAGFGGRIHVNQP